jgi:hypothetical protein
MNEAEEKLFRRYEKQLDDYHKSLPLWGRPRPEGVYAVMAIPDMALLPLFRGPVPPVLTGPQAQRLKGLEEGAAQALRWLTEAGCTSVRSVTDRDLIDAAYQFCMHAAAYVTIADFHILYGRGWATARVDPQSPTVTFDTAESPGQHDAFAWHEQVREHGNRGVDLAMKMKPSDVKRGRQLLREVKHQLVDGHIRLARLPNDLVDKARGIVPFLKALELLPLPSATDMLGFTMGEFLSFLETVTVWSQTAFMRFCDCVAQGVPLHECMPIQIVAKDEFVDQVTALSHLSSASAQTILDRVTFRPARKADVLLTPFLIGEGSVCWSPVGIMKYAHQRNLLKVMSRGMKDLREHAATVNGKRDRALGQLIGKKFATHGFQFNLDTPVAANAERTDIDVLLYQTARPDEVLIIEAKALITPDEINEVYNASQTLVYAQEQVRRAMRILGKMPLVEKQQKFKFVDWDKVAKFYGVVITTDAEAHWTIDHQEIPVLTYNSLRWRFRPRDYRCPSRFWAACVQRPWQDGEMRIEEDIHVDFRVGDLLYRLPAGIVDSGISKVETEKVGQLVARHRGT